MIADIQYVDANDAMNFQQTKWRRYRSSLEIYRQALRSWTHDYKVDFSIILGDLIDGRAAAHKTQHTCLNALLEIEKQLPLPRYLCFGNHCHYCFSRAELKALAARSCIARDHDQSNCPLQPNGLELYYSWSPAPGWRFISVDGYEVSLIAAGSHEHHANACALVKQHNPNDLTDSNGWFDNLPADKRRFVPYNGGISQAQLHWLEGLLRSSCQRKEKVVVFCHQAIFSPDRPKSLLWNAEEVLSVLHRFDDTVVLWLAGHDHKGQSAVDPHGIHHLVPPAPIECESGDTAFGVMEVHAEHLRWIWHGSPPTSSWHPWPSIIPFNKAS